ncbi:CHAT domain-containing protein [Aquimarina rhabdastrellae]
MSSQNCYEHYLILKAQDKITAKEVDELLNSYCDNAKEYAEVVHYFAMYFYKKKEYDLAIEYCKVEANYFEKEGSINFDYENVLFNLGFFHHKNQEFSKGISYFQKVISTNVTQNKVARSYGEIGKYYRRKGEFYKALEYSKKGIHLLETDTIENAYSQKNLLSLYINTSLICDFLDNKEASFEGISFLKRADSLVKLHKNILTLNRYYSLNAAYANLYATEYLNDFDKAKKYYSKNLNRAFKDEDSWVIANSYVNLGELYLQHKKDSALFYLEKSLVYEKDDEIKNAESYRNIAVFYNEKKNNELALKNIEKSLNWSFSQDEELINKRPTSLQLLETTDRRNIFIALRTKIKILLGLYHQTKKISYLEEAIQVVDISDELVDIIIDDSFEISTKLLWREEASKTYMLGINIAYLLGREETMLNFMEKNRALLLIQAIKENIKQEELPKKVLNKRLKLKKNILKLEEEVLNQKEEDYNKKKDFLFELKEEYQVLNHSIYKKNLGFFNSKSEIEKLSIKDIQNELDTNTVIISYALDENKSDDKGLYGVVLSKEKYFSFKLNNTNDFLSKVDEYRVLISKPLKTKQELNRFRTIAYALYTNLFPGTELQELIKNKNLLVIPDISLQDVPFEALNTNNKELEYLIEHNNISYAYSISFLQQNKEIKRQTKRDFIGFAPVDFSNKTLASLHNTKEEISTINEILDGEAYLFNEANKKSFLTKSIDAKIIHLATHAKSSKNPEIYFVNDTIKLHELYTHKNNADLVVLSACETNIGKVNKGEGVFSLARGFFYSGANAVISSLWNANDTSTSSIMKDFYEDLYKSSSKVEALGNAKRKYIKEHSLSDKSPFYWASFVLIGDTNQTFNKGFNWLYLIGFIAVFIFILFFSKKGGNKIEECE